jgi:hypothetical protein
MRLFSSSDVSFLPAGVVNPLSRRVIASELLTGGGRKPAHGAGRRGGKGSGALPVATTFAAALSDKGGGN